MALNRPVFVSGTNKGDNSVSKSQHLQTKNDWSRAIITDKSRITSSSTDDSVFIEPVTIYKGSVAKVMCAI